MAYRIYIPRPPLSEFVSLFWSQEGYDPSHAVERVIPTGTMQLIFSLREDELRVYDRQDHHRFRSLGGSLISGAHSRFVVIDTTSAASTVGVHFKVGGAPPFLGVAADELRDADVPLESLWGTKATELRDQLLEAGTPEARFRLLERALLAQVVRPLAHHPAVAFALEEFRTTSRMKTISEVVELTRPEPEAVHRTLLPRGRADAKAILSYPAIPGDHTPERGRTARGVGGGSTTVRLLRPSALRTRLPRVLRHYSDGLCCTSRRASQPRPAVTTQVIRVGQFLTIDSAFLAVKYGMQIALVWIGVSVKNGVNAVPEGFHTVTPYLMGPDVEGLVEFMGRAFGAQEVFRARGEAGGMHTEVKMGDSMVMVGGKHDSEPQPAAIFLYMDGVDDVYGCALEAGATSIEEPADRPEGDRRAGVADPFGNAWFIATRIENISREELQKRWDDLA